MKVSRERKENSEMVLDIELEPTEMEKSLEEAYRRIVNRVMIPGFRKGKAPRAILERHVGKDALRQEALQHLVPEVYNRAIEEHQIDTIDQPRIEITQLDPVVLRATVPLRPTVKLGDYRSIREEPETAEVAEEEIEATLESLRKQQAVWEPVERSVDFGDLITLSVEGSRSDGTPINEEEVPYRVIKGSPMPLPGFAEELVGMEVGQEREFRISYPDDYPVTDLAGKEFSFKASVSEIKEERLPELDDEFARSLGLGVDNLDALREKVASDLRLRAEQAAQRRYEEKVIEAAVALAEVDYPNVIVEREINRILDEQAQRFREGYRGLEEYFRSINKTVDEVRGEFRPQAVKRVVRSLALNQIMNEEKLEVTPGEIDAEIEMMVNDAKENSEAVAKFFASPAARLTLERSLLTRKTVARLTAIARGEMEETIPVAEAEPDNDQEIAQDSEVGE